MKRPNSGWNTGAVLLSPLSRRQRMFYSHFRGKILLWLAAARQVWHTSTLLQKLCITGQCLENIGLSQGKLDLFVLVVEFYDKILDLVAPEQSIALLSLCVAPNGEQLLPCISESGQLIAVSVQAYLNAPFAHMARLLFRFRPIERRSNGSVTRSVNITSSFWPALRLQAIVGLGVQQTHERGSDYWIRAVEGFMSRSLQPLLESLAQFVLDIAYLFILTASSLADPAG